MKKHTFLILFVTLLAVLAGCDHNVYLPSDEPYPKEIWEVQSKHFFKFSDALSYYMGTLGSKDIAPENTITLLRDVPESERGEAIIIPDTFPEDGVVRVDFNGHEYWFEDNLEYFFEVRSGETVEIVNGTTVIDVPANPVPMALVVNTKTVTIDDHLIDDRRPTPKAIEVQKKGILKVNSSSSSSRYALRGEVTVFGGGQIDVEGGFVEASTFDVASVVNLTSGYILVSEKLNINTNGKVNVSGGYLSADTIDAKSSDNEQKAEFHLSGGDMDTSNLNAGDNSLIVISQPDPENPTQAFISNTTITSAASFTVSDGDVTFRSSIEKETDGTFEISGGTIHNPHVLTPYVEQAIIEGGGTETTTNVVIHEPIEAHAKKDPTCTEEGYEAYWICIYDGCGRWFNDENCTDENTSKTPVVIPALGHDLSHHDHKDPTCTEDGNIEYWQCSRCEKYFADEEATEEITQSETIIQPTGHNWNTVYSYDSEMHWHECLNCGAIDEKVGHDFTVLFNAETENTLFCVTGCEECAYSATSASIPSSTGAFALIQSVNGVSAVKNDAVTWTITVSDEIKNSYASCKWFNANQTEQLENTTTDFAPITLSVAVDEQIDWIRIFCLYYDSDEVLVSGGYVYLHK